MKLRVDVKKSHIKNGQRDSGKYCPIALAIKSVMNTDNFYVISSKIRGYDKNDKYFMALLPTEAKKFIKKFDNLDNPKNKFVPFSFDIEICY